MAQSAQNREHGIKVFTVFAMFGDFDEMFDDFHAFDRVVFGTDFGANPKHLAIHCAEENFKVSVSELQKKNSKRRQKQHY